MRINEHIALATSRVLLVPYCRHHVPTYHEWMKDEDLQQATASEPLTLDEEYAMQQTWREDADKLTFIACLPSTDDLSEQISAVVEDAPSRMIGDVNLFLFEDEASEPEEENSPPDKVSRVTGEIEIMIARKDLHKRGYGRATLLTFMHYIEENMGQIVQEFAADSALSLQSKRQLEYLRVKIGSTNTRSIALFESVGFMRTTEEPNYFGELELRLDVSVSIQQRLHAEKHFENPRRLPYIHKT